MPKAHKLDHNTLSLWGSLLPHQIRGRFLQCRFILSAKLISASSEGHPENQIDPFSISQSSFVHMVTPLSVDDYTRHLEETAVFGVPAGAHASSKDSFERLTRDMTGTRGK
jgi:hypothetical protein